MKKEQYQPKYDDEMIDKLSDQINASGFSGKRNVQIEEGEQRRIAESETWHLARHGNRVSDVVDTKSRLEELGFTVEPTDDPLFYACTPPEGWTKSTHGYWTTIKDADGNERMTMFFKGAWYDRDAFLNFS